MKNILIILTATLFITLSVKGQNFFFFDGNSYPCSETFTLQANSEDGNNLNVLFAKDETAGLFVVSTKSDSRVIFSGNLIIYLDDGEVITCIDRGNIGHGDNTATAMYSLTNEELTKMKKSNINTVKYTLKCGPCYGFYSTERGNWSASNKGTPTKTVITEFFK